MEQYEINLLERAKQKKKALIEDYDMSQGVNSFGVNGNLYWFDKATRVGLVNSLQIEKAAGREVGKLWFDTMAIEMPIDDALKMLSTIELYAVECNNTTKTHLVNVDALTDLNRVHNYNYTKGYPKRLYFEL